MKKSKDAKVQDFINQLMVLDHDKYEIVQAARKVLFATCPKASERIMYGGILFSDVEDFAGVFAYKNHVSFEFSKGYLFKDSEKLLEGNGKFRRHLKMKSLDSPTLEKLEYYVSQAHDLRDEKS